MVRSGPGRAGAGAGAGRREQQRSPHADMARTRPHGRLPTAAKAWPPSPHPRLGPGAQYHDSPPPRIRGTSGNVVPSLRTAPGYGAGNLPKNYNSQDASRQGPLKLLTSARGQTKRT